MNFTSSLIFTVAIALPAYMGRLNVSSETTSRTSVTGALSHNAASLGSQFLPTLELAARTWVYEELVICEWSDDDQSSPVLGAFILNTLVTPPNVAA